MIQENIAVSSPHDHFVFCEADLAISQDDTALHRVATSGSAKLDAVEAVAPAAGSIVAISYQLAANKTAGALAFNPTINGTAVTFGVTAADDTDHGVATQRAGKTRFNKGDSIGAAYTTDANFLPAASDDVFVDVWVVYDPFRV